MTKLNGNLRIARSAESEKSRPHFEVSFVPYAGRVKTQAVRLAGQDDVVEFLMKVRISEDESSRWAGKAQSEGIVLIPDVHLTEDQLRENGLII
ncbi:MAG: hypothetical protein ACRD3T_13220 [Terriglobia bacterium]